MQHCLSTFIVSTALIKAEKSPRAEGYMEYVAQLSVGLIQCQRIRFGRSEDGQHSCAGMQGNRAM